jgi:hypothetical protein
MSRIRTLLETKHFSKEGRLLPDSYKGWSRSFTKHFIECLYLPHANILTGAPYAVADVIGAASRPVDSDSNTPTTKNCPKGNMQLAGPCGQGIVVLPMGDIYTGGSGGFFPGEVMPGHAIGIQIGRSNTAVTPLDAFLNDRIAHGVHAAVGASVIDSFAGADNGDYNFASTGGYVGIIYRPIRSHSMADIQLKCWKTGSPGNVTVVVTGIENYLVSAPCANATVLATSNIVNANAWGGTPGALVTFTFASPPVLHAGWTYFIAITPSQASGGNSVNIRTSTTVLLSRVMVATSVTPIGPGVSLSSSGQTPLFQIDGTAGNEMEYGATDLYGYTVANPNASFTLRRIFMNNSGNSITVQECGIYLPVTRYWTGSNTFDYSNFIVCAAHDTFAGIAVNNGESLEIDYTPSITV